jgi:hypothetical protein
MKDYAKPVIVDYGSLAKLTEACDFPGSGDFRFPDSSHAADYVTSDDFCHSKP